MHGRDNIELCATAGSRDTPYTVEVVPENGNICVFCNCPAGNMTRLCKHKIGVVMGDLDVLEDPGSQQEAWSRAQALLESSSLRTAVADLQSAIADPAFSKDRIRSMKMSVARKMANGG